MRDARARAIFSSCSSLASMSSRSSGPWCAIALCLREIPAGKLRFRERALAERGDPIHGTGNIRMFDVGVETRLHVPLILESSQRDVYGSALQRAVGGFDELQPVYAATRVAHY